MTHADQSGSEIPAGQVILEMRDITKEFPGVKALSNVSMIVRREEGMLRRYCHAQSYAPGAPPLSFSAGVFSGLADDLEGFLHEADRRLYQAKRQGRGRTCLVLEAD